MNLPKYDPIHDVLAGLKERGFEPTEIKPPNGACSCIVVQKGGEIRLIGVVLMPPNADRTRPITTLEKLDHFTVQTSAGATSTHYVFVSGGDELYIEWSEVDAQ